MVLLAGLCCTGTLSSCSGNNTPSFGVPDDPDGPDKPTPDYPAGVRTLTMTVGELLYYGAFKQSPEEVFFLYLKDADPLVDCNIGLYINVPTVTDKTRLHLPDGKYRADASRQPMTFTNREVAEGKSFWWTISPKTTEHLVISGSLEVQHTGNTYRIGGLLMENETDGIQIVFEGELPCEDCSGSNEKPIRDMTLTVGELIYYGLWKESREGLYFLNLKDADPIVDCNIGLYVNVTTVTDKYALTLPDGTYRASSSWEPMTFNDATVVEGKSFWWTISPRLTQHLIQSGVIDVKRSGDSYTITGTLMESETAGIRLSFSGSLPAEDWSDREDPAPEVVDVTMTLGELMYYGADNDYGTGGDIYFLYLKDADPVRYYNMGLYINVPKQGKSDLFLPDGTYMAASSWEPMTINNNQVEKYKSHWYSLDPWTQHLLSTGSIVVSRSGDTYTITGTLMETGQRGVRISFSGKLPVADYSDEAPDPNLLTEVR